MRETLQNQWNHTVACVQALKNWNSIHQQRTFLEKKRHYYWCGLWAHLVCICIYLHQAQSCFLDYASRDSHHKLVENPNQWGKLFPKFYPSIRLHTSTNPSICLVPNICSTISSIVEGVSSFILLFSSLRPTSSMSKGSQLPSGISKQVLDSSHHWRITKELVQLTSNLQSFASSQPSSIILDLLYAHNKP